MRQRFRSTHALQEATVSTPPKLGMTTRCKRKLVILNGNGYKPKPSFDSAMQRNNQCIINKISLNRKLRAPAVAAFLTICAVFADPEASPAASATWSTNPPSGDWNSASNWVPMTVPNGPSDNATFQTSNQTFVSLSADTEVNGIIFNSGASFPFEIVNSTATTLTISGTGVSNSSGITQTFFISGHIAFTNASRAGDFTSFTNVGTITSRTRQLQAALHLSITPLRALPSSAPQLRAAPRSRIQAAIQADRA